MKKSWIVSFILTGALAIGSSLAVSSFAGDGQRVAAGDRQWLTIPQVHQKLEAAGYRSIEKIERESGGYEVRATDRQGERVKLYLNPQTGEILGQGAGKRDGKRDNKHDDKRDSARDNKRDGTDAAKRLRGSGDCNERRCRDDLPGSGVTPSPAPAAR